MIDPRSRRVSEAAPARLYELGHEPADNLAATTTAEERIEMVGILTRRAWELSGRPWPVIPRDQWPVIITRPR
jgi:hypothetical protein